MYIILLSVKGSFYRNLLQSSQTHSFWCKHILQFKHFVELSIPKGQNQNETKRGKERKEGGKRGPNILRKAHRMLCDNSSLVQ